MPSLGSHLARAHMVAERLRIPEIDDDRGSYYFGATAPDIRVITRLDRRVTHFFELDDYERQDSVQRMFEEHPGLARPAGLETATSAFVAGYITHLVLDEAYIEDVYRPEFGHLSVIADDPRRNALDRALQYELDRRDRENREAMAEVCAALTGCDPLGEQIPFIADEHLVQWRVVAADVAAQAPDYSRFRRMMARHLADAGLSDDEIDEFCASPEAAVGQAFAHVTSERIDGFWVDAGERMHDRVRQYFR
ncbi:MAG: hypothetical protein WEB13_02855 [Dehalococcoidia bacterium]